LFARPRLLRGCAWRRGDLSEQQCLILIRQKARWNSPEQQDGHGRYESEGEQRPSRARNHPIDADAVAAGHPLKPRLNQPNGPRMVPGLVWSAGFSMVAHNAGVRISATSTESAIADTIVTENWR